MCDQSIISKVLETYCDENEKLLSLKYESNYFSLCAKESLAIIESVLDAQLIFESDVIWMKQQKKKDFLWNIHNIVEKKSTLFRYVYAVGGEASHIHLFSDAVQKFYRRAKDFLIKLKNEEKCVLDVITSFDRLSLTHVDYIFEKAYTSDVPTGIILNGSENFEQEILNKYSQAYLYRWKNIEIYTSPFLDLNIFTWPLLLNKYDIIKLSAEEKMKINEFCTLRK